jgi:soluble lytic murein transglycosylase
MMNLKRLPLIALMLISVGCTLNAQPEQPVLVVTETPNIQTVGQIAQPTIEPTPTVEPAILLRIADRYLLNGYYENAVYSYQALLSQTGAPADAQAAAAFGLGQSALREGLFADAVNALTTFITQFPTDARIAQAHFLRGDAYMGASLWDNAISDFKLYLTLRPGLLDSYAHERIGDAQLALGQAADALTSYETASDAARSLVPQLALRERVAQIYSNANQPAQALEQYEAILAAAQNYAYRAGIDLLAARALLAMGSTEAGLDRMEAIMQSYPDRPEAYHAMQALIDGGRAVNNLARGRVSFNYGDYQGAIDAFNTYTVENPGNIPAELYLLLGRAYREIGSTAAAVTAFQTIISSYPTDDLFGDALLEQGRTLRIGGDTPGAIAHYTRIADTYGYLPQAAEALYRAGFLYLEAEQPTEARAVFERLADRFPDTQQAKDGLFLAASSAYTTNDIAAAERFYAELAVKTTGDDQAAAYWWVGRLALLRGDQRTAQEAFTQVRTAAPDSYYAARADDLLNNIQPFQRPAALRFQFDDAAEVAQAEAWLRQTYGITQEGALWQLPDELANDPRLVRGRELWTVAAYDEARAEFNDLIEANRTTPLASYQLAIYFRGIAAYQESIVAASYVIRNANIGTLDAPPYIARMRYPAYYLDVAQEVSDRRGLDPLLLFSLIRHESLFDTYATAAAGEKGLTQVVPSTAEYIAGEIQWQDYQHSDLFRPYAGIEFGAFYLQEQLNRFGGNTVAALAGYNAGPGRAASWLQLSGGDPDQFMTAISIDSTRTYVQRIYGYYNIYRALYGA